MVRALEAHSGLGALIAENTKADRIDGFKTKKVGFNAVWSSSMTSSASKGKPDIEAVDTSARLGMVEDMVEVSNLPVIYDADTGGLPAVFKFTVKTLERMGVSACIIKDKSGLKQNTDRQQALEDIPTFCEKIKAGQSAKTTEDFMIIANLEALISGLGEEEALKRAKAYIEAGADGIMIQSKEKGAEEILSFLEAYSKFENKVPVVAVPTTYNAISEAELEKAGVSICVYANQMLRAAYPSMVSTAESILKHGRSKEADSTLMPVKDIITLIQGGPTKARSTMTELVRDFLDPATFVKHLQKNDVDFFVGTPDSLLKDVVDYITDHADQVTAPNEGSAVAIAAGYHIATGKVPMVYLQNSGLGNTVNPLLSLADPKVYGTPMLLLIGWRGQPGKKDEPQHLVQGKRMKAMLDSMKIPSAVLPDFFEGDEGAQEVIDNALKVAKAQSQPYAILVKKQTFERYDRIEQPVAPDLDPKALTREEALRSCLSQVGERDVCVGTTGFTSREIYEIRNDQGQDHSKDFLTVGAMGHASAIALGIAMHAKDRNVVCFDGDGAMLMHMGNVAVIGSLQPENLKHVLLNNGAHDSVGGNPTFFKKAHPIATSVGYKWVKYVSDGDDVAKAFAEMLNAPGPGLLEIQLRSGTRSDLGRPKESPVENKRELMKFLGN